jgi:uncharacterized protein (DUF58 family)
MKFAWPRPRQASGRIVLRPTAAGLFWLVAVVALLATAINYANNIVFALAFLMLGAWLQSAWDCRRNLAGIECRVLPPPPAFAGEALAVSVSAEAGGRARRQIALAWEKGEGAKVGAGKTARTGGAPDKAVLQLGVPAVRRGRQRLDALALASSWPLGLWRARRTLPAVEALVYPAPTGAAALPRAAPNPAHRRCASADFQDLRAYAPGDAPRRINWRAFARREELLINNFDGGAGGHALWLDLALCAGDLEERLCQLAAWVLAAEHEGREYGLRLGDAGLPPGIGRSHREACLRRLALHGMETAA